ncbi:HlyD family secretion protein [Rheinheimera sp. EpRS3]|uniref:HlyD family secretion protein n=1 Tax=Rheinheimera sp. EpRS3 TaxID=1712383 RepID=UPI00074AE794|nr:HlyD family efflux transporter periplasmic adaptor subunit [Rheinheimera sp. EpRS3]KUM52173.1 multidrug transporter [Rheinheimera sp. EpRS3]
MSSDSLFRAEAVQHQGVKLDGSVVIAQPIKVSVLVGILLLVVVMAVLFLSQASFNRKETVVGYLKPDLGLARVAPQRSGTIVELFVADGDSVSAGQKLALISSEEYLAHGSNLSGQLLLSLEQQQQTLQLRLDEYQLLYIQQHQTLQDRIDNLLSQLTEIRSQQQLMQQRELLNKQRLADIETLHREGHISATELNNQRELLLSMQQQRTELLINYQQQQGQLIQLKSQLAALPREHEQQKAQLATELARLSQQHSELSARGEILVTAPVAGRITNLVAQAGGMAQAGKSMLTILPENSNLYAVLLVPTRAFGFIQPGQEARLRYDAFPYQRFGLYRGKVVQQSKAILLPNEVDMPVSLTEPVYQVNVQLDQQQIAAYGDQVPLQAGMLLSADIMLEQRSLLSWLFEPLFSLRGRL